MPGLPKSYIKKYGVSKRAWREYRKAKSSRKSSPRPVKRTKSKTKARSYTMPRKKVRRTSRSKSTLTPKDAVMYGLGYGVVRTPINDGLKKLTSNFAVNLSDELVLGGLMYFAAKKNWFGQRKLWTTGLAVEAHNFGRQVQLGGLSNLFGTQSNTGDNL